MAERETLGVLRARTSSPASIGPDAAQIEAMLAVVEARSLEDLVKQATPAARPREHGRSLCRPLDEQWR